jgi:predicted dehydrogenase
VRVAIAGIGFMGWIHWLAWKSVPGVRITAIFSQEEERRRGDWTGIKGNFGPPGQRVDLSGISVHDSLESLWADGNVDLFDICLPPGIHATATVAALESGRHVFCEKPMALGLGDCDKMLSASERTGKKLLVGHVLPFFPEFRFVQQAAADGRYGKLLGGNFQRTISEPTWIPGFFDRQKVGGPLVDLLVHDAHFVRTLLGMPRSIFAAGRTRHGLVEYMSATCRFDDSDQVATCRGGVIRQQGRPFTHGFEVHFEKATIQFEFAGLVDQAELMPLKVLTEDGTVFRPDLGNGDPVHAFEAEVAEVHRVVSSKTGSSPLLDGQLARDALQIVEMISESVLTGQAVARGR